MLMKQELVFIIFIFVYERKFEEYLNLVKKKKEKKNWTEILEFKLILALVISRAFHSYLYGIEYVR